MKYQKKKFHFWIPKYTLETTNYVPKYLDRKYTTKPFLTSTQHPKSLKSNISYSQILGIKGICSTKIDFDRHSSELKDRFIKLGYDQKLVDEQLKKVDKLVRDDLLQEKDRKQQDSKSITLILTYNRFLPNLTAVVCKNWNILQTNKNLRGLFQEHSITAFK